MALDTYDITKCLTSFSGRTQKSAKSTLHSNKTQEAEKKAQKISIKTN